LGCFSGPCLQTGAIVKVMAQRFGLPADKFKVYTLQGDDIRPGVTCQALQSSTFVSPAGLSESVTSLLIYLRTLPLECVTYSLDWLDLSRDEGS
jgi:hypothetical protein